MRKFGLIAIITLVASIAWGQQNSCLIVKHKGTVGRRLMWTALIGIPIAPGAKYDYVDSTNFPNSRMSYGGKQLEEIQASGTHVIVLDKFSADGVAAARQSCAAVAANTTPSTPAKQVVIAKAPESVEHPIEGYTLSGPETDVGNGEPSLAEAARRAKAKKQAQGSK